MLSRIELCYVMKDSALGDAGHMHRRTPPVPPPANMPGLDLHPSGRFRRRRRVREFRHDAFHIAGAHLVEQISAAAFDMLNQKGRQTDDARRVFPCVPINFDWGVCRVL
jgi:hypothetical protein